MGALTRRLGTLWLAVVVAALALTGCGAAAPLVDKAAYAAAVLDQVGRAGTSISALSALAGSPQLDDPTWRAQVDQQITDLRGLIGEARALTPPEALAGVHQTYLSALAQLEQVTVTVESAVGTGDPARLLETVPLLAEVARLLTAAQGLIGR
jgi:hypothetical protein